MKQDPKAVASSEADAVDVVDATEDLDATDAEDDFNATDAAEEV